MCNPPFKIAYLIDTISCNTSGTEKQLLGVIKRLDKRKFQPYIVCLHSSCWLETNHLPCSCIILNYEGLLSCSLPFVIKKLRNFFFEHQIHLIQTFFEDSIFVAWLTFRLLPQNVVLLSSRRDMGLGTENHPWYHQLYGVVLPFVTKSFDGIIANSNQIKKYLAERKKIPQQKIEVIYNGVKSPPNNKKIPSVFIWNSVICWIVIVASLTPVKRHDVLIKAISRLKDKFKENEVKILVLGEGVLSEPLMAQVTQENIEGFFIFKGAVHNVADYLQQCDIGVLCSDREGLSNAILEYMACGLPVVATAVGGNIELIDATNGICIPPGNPPALADALQQLIVDKEKRQQLGQTSRQKAEHKFSWHHSMHHLEAYYEKMLKNRRIAHGQ
ncbi:MAG: glycosyltransferase family 4 protein [Candidatus Electrothrix communis]|nr:MAG: glycosyltransferase family 4 protein [Candidatus Electrothrix communis]